jgi:hypothetical protein
VIKRDISFLKWAALILVAGFLLIQLLPYGRDYDNPPVIQEPDWDTPATLVLVEQACFDCHSNETEWPWYAYIAPMSWLLARDVEKGREVLNFSEWETGSAAGEAEVEEMVEVISKNQMPLPYYVILHPEADLTDAEKGQLINGLIATLGESEGPLESQDLDTSE